MTSTTSKRRCLAAVLVAAAHLYLPHRAAAQETTAGVPHQLAAAEATTAGAPRQLLAAVHAHSTASSGALPLSELARLARQSGLDVVVLAENLGYEFRYAPAGLRLFAEARVSTPTLEDYGISRFLADLESARSVEPSVVMLPGAEVPPYYYWTGSLLRGDLTLHDMQRNLLVVPPPTAIGSSDQAAGFFEGIPAVGNRYHRRYGTRTLALLLPGLLLVGLSARKIAGMDTRGFHRPTVRTSTDALVAAALLVSGGALLYTNFPFSAPSLDPYRPHDSPGAAEDLLAYVRRNGGLSFWSMPEAHDYHERGLGPFTVRLSTHPYADVLKDAPGYTGFGGVYADTVTVWEAGSIWDEALAAYQSGRRATAPWIIGESAFHYSGQARKQLSDVVTVLLVDGPGEAGVFSALAGGRSYALRRSEGAPDLRLAEFSLTPVDADNPSAVATPARCGQTLTVSAGGNVEAELEIRVEDIAGTGTPLQVDIVRNGRLHRRIDATTPFAGRWREAVDSSEGSVYYRVVVRATRAAYLVANPIFLRRRP